MTSSHSHSLLMVWQLANVEAKRLHAGFLEPPHLLLGLCKCVDLDIPAALPPGTPGRDALLEELLRECRILREVFQKAGFDPVRFRRRFRKALPEGSAGLNPAAGNLHRSGAARDVFVQAEKLAHLSGGVVFPTHLLCCLMTEADALRDQTMAQMGAEPRRLREGLWQEVFVGQDRTRLHSGAKPTRWN